MALSGIRDRNASRLLNNALFYMEHQARGFEIAHDDRTHLVKVALWGAWNSEVAEQFERSLRQQLDTQMTDEWSLLLDLTHFPEQPETVEHILTNALLLAKEQGMKEKAVLSKKAAMPFRSDVFSRYPELKIHFYFHAETDAMRWLQKAAQRH